MAYQETLDTLTRIPWDLLAYDRIVLTMQTTLRDVPGWDSFTYVNFIVAAEAEFRGEIRIADVASIVANITARQRH